MLSFTFATVADAERFIEGADEDGLANAGLDVYPPMFVGTPLEIVDERLRERSVATRCS